MLEEIDGQGDQGMDDGSHEIVEVNMASANDALEQDINNVVNNINNLIDADDEE